MAKRFANHAQVAVLNQQARSLDHLSERIARLESARSKVLVDGASTALETTNPNFFWPPAAAEVHPKVFWPPAAAG